MGSEINTRGNETRTPFQSSLVSETIVVETPVLSSESNQ